MPAVLNEAFNSPFHQFNQFRREQQEHDIRSSSGTESLHNPLFGFQVNQSTPMLQEQQNVHRMHQAPQAQQIHRVQQAPQTGAHDCDRLIAMIMACPHCRQKVRELMSKTQTQNGGAMTLPSVDISKLSTATIGNFIFGIAVLFLVDRIIKLKLKA